MTGEVYENLAFEIFESVKVDAFCLFFWSGLDEPDEKAIKNFILEWGERNKNLLVGVWAMGSDVHKWASKEFGISRIPTLVLFSHNPREPGRFFVKIDDPMWFRPENVKQLQQLLFQMFNMVIRAEYRDTFKLKSKEERKKKIYSIISRIAKMIHNVKFKAYEDHIEVEFG